MRYCVAATLLFLFSYQAFSQKLKFDHQFRNYTLDDGLPSTQIYEIIQDSIGYIWFGTDRGLVKYNGYEFKSYSVQDGLSNNVIFKLGYGPNGELACYGKDRRIHFFRNGKFEPYMFNDSLVNYISIEGNLESFVFHNGELAIFEASEIEHRNHFVQNTKTGDIHFPSDRMELIDNRFGVHMNLDLSLVENHVYFRGRPIYEVSGIPSHYTLFAETTKTKGVYFFSIGNELYSFDPNNKRALLVERFDRPIIDLKSDEDGKIYSVVDQTGIYVYNYDDWKHPEVILKGKDCSNILLDKAGGIWVATLFDGLFYSPVSLQKTKILNSNDFFPNALISRSSRILMKSQENRIYEVIEDSLVELKEVFDKNVFSDSDLFISFSSDKFLRSSIACNLSQNCYFQTGNYSQRTVYHKGIFSFTARNFIRLIRANTEGPNLFYKIDDYLNDILFLDEKNILCASDKGILLLDLNQLDTLTPEKEGSSKETYNPQYQKYRPDIPYFQKKIRTVINVGDSLRIYGSSESGVYLEYLNGQQDQILDIEDGLLSNEIEKLNYCEEKLIIITKEGLSILNKQNELAHYTVKNGLPSNDIFGAAIANDTLWVSTREGLVIILPDQKPLNSPPIVFTEMSINGSKAHTSNSYQLDYSKDVIEFSFEALSYEQEADLTYKYILKGLDPNWVTTKSRTVRYVNLPYGEFSFWVSAEKPNGVFTPPVHLFDLQRVKPFWQWKIFIESLFLVGIGLIYFILLRRLKRQRKMQEDKLIMLNLERKALQAQMNPHFMFNSMTSLQSLILDDKKTESHEFLERFAMLTRHSLNHSTQNLITLKEEIEMLKLYIELEQIRFGQNFTYRIIDDIDRPHQKIAPMLIQPFVENAIIHGLNKKKSGGKLTIKFASENESVFTCTITDNGGGRKKGKTDSKRKSLGIQLVKERLSILLNKTVKEPVEIIDLIENEIPVGTKIIVTLPVNPKVL